MISYNKTFTVTSDCPVEDICSEINLMMGEDCSVQAWWDEHEDGTMTVTIDGYTHTDELTFDYTVDTIQEQIDKLKEFHTVVPDQFLAVILGGYSPVY